MIVADSLINTMQVCGDAVGISAVVAAMMGLSVLLLTGVLSWRDCLTYPPAWDTLFWFAVLVGVHSLLSRHNEHADRISQITKFTDLKLYMLSPSKWWLCIYSIGA